MHTYPCPLYKERPLKSKSEKMMHTYANNRQKRSDVSRILIGSVIAISCKISGDPHIMKNLYPIHMLILKKGSNVIIVFEQIK